MFMLRFALLLASAEALWTGGKCEICSGTAVCASYEGSIPPPGLGIPNDIPQLGDTRFLKFSIYPESTDIQAIIADPTSITDNAPVHSIEVVETGVNNGCDVTINDQSCQSCSVCNDGTYTTDCTNLQNGISLTCDDHTILFPLNGNSMRSGVVPTAAPLDPPTQAPIKAPTTKAPTTNAPTTKAPITKAPTTKAPTTKAPITNAPTTKAPTTRAPTTKAPTTKAPSSQAPVSMAPISLPPVSQAPISSAPAHATAAPTAKMTSAPSKLVTTTLVGLPTVAPTTQAPVSLAPLPAIAAAEPTGKQTTSPSKDTLTSDPNTSPASGATMVSLFPALMILLLLR